VIRLTTIGTFFAASIAVSGGPALAEETELTITPNKCVALRKGQTCYQSIVVRYNAPDKSDLCLVRDDLTEPLVCWKNITNVEYSYRFVSDKSVWFRIVGVDQTSKASARVNVSWVYKRSRKRNRWRLF